MTWTWILATASLIGTIANIYKRRWCFAVWLCTNSAWCIYDLSIGQHPQAALFAVYAALAAWGLRQWKRTV